MCCPKIGQKTVYYDQYNAKSGMDSTQITVQAKDISSSSERLRMLLHGATPELINFKKKLGTYGQIPNIWRATLKMSHFTSKANH